MKQTNNAIKFLMAQYRAIFRNANLKMFLAAATAAAALSATQAQAAKALDASILQPLTSGDTFTLNGDDAATGAKNTYTNLTLEVANQGNDIVINNDHVFNVTGGSQASGSSFDSKDTAAKKISLASSTLNITSAKTAADTEVKVGATNAVNVEFGTINVNKGTLDIAKGSISAANITIGGAENAKAGDALVKIGEGSLGAADAKGNKTSSIILKTGAKVTPEHDTKSKILGQVTVSGGEISVADGKQLTVDGSFTAENGTVTLAAKGAKLVLENGGIFKAGTVATSGAITVNGETTFEAGALGENKTGADATLTIGSTATKTVKVSMDSKTFGTLTKEDTNKIIAADVAGSTSEIHFSDSGDAALNLGKTGAGALKIFDENGGIVATTLDKQTNGKFKLSGKAATFAGATINNNSELAFDSFSAGDSGAGAELKVSGGAVISVKDGLTVIAKDATKASLNIVDGKVNLNGTNGKAGTVSASTVALKGADKAKAQFNISGGDWTVTGLEVTSGDVSIARDASLIISGGKFTSAADKANGVISANGGHINAAKASEVKLQSAGVLELKNTATLTLDKSKIFKTDGSALDDTKFVKGSVAGDANTKLIIMDGDKKLKFADDKAFTAFYNSTGFKGLFDVDFTPAVKSGEVAFTDLVAGLDNNSYSGVTATTDGATGVSGVYAVGNVKVTDNQDLSIKAGGALTLNGANGGDFVVKTPSAGKTETANVDFAAAGTSLTLKGTGNLGSVTATNNGEGALTIGATGDEATQTKPVPGIVTVLKGNNIGTSATKRVGQLIVNEQSILNVESGSVFTNTLAVHDDATFNVSGDIVADSAQVDGYLKANTLTLSGTAGPGATSVEHNFASANVEVTKLVLADKNVLNIGQFDANVKENNHTATVYADTLELNKGGLFIDPDYELTKSSAVVMNLSGAATKYSAGTLDGKVAVGKNAAFGVGFNSLAEMDAAIGGYLTDGHFTEDTTNGGVHNALVLNKQIKLDSTNGGGIMVGENASISGTTVNKVVLGANSALVITDKVFEDNGGVKSGVAITAGSFDVTGAELVLVGDFNAKDDNLQIFSANPTGSMKVKSANGLLVLDKWTNGSLSLKIDEDVAKVAFLDSAAPIRELLLDSKRGELGSGDGLGRDLINEVASASLSGAVADAAAHAATYAGAQQAAVAAVTTMAEAVGGRVGSMGVETAVVQATGSQANGGVWLSPMYKSVDADGFNAQGGSYGADVDLAGVAFGADTVNGNMRFGAVFNIGSGDADGKGNGNGLKDEFDYYGIGIYSVMGFGNLALVGDASLNVISHDVEGLGLKGEADTTAVTMGVTGQYTISNPMVDVTPHLGARFIRLDTDSYDLTNAEGVVATTDFEVQNVFSVPLGVTLSKAFEMGGWSLAPSADLSITFNTGDTEVDSTTRFTGINRNIGLNTEVLDEVTYGVAVGLGAQYGAFGTQIGINYTGSENTDAFGVNANARYMF